MSFGFFAAYLWMLTAHISFQTGLAKDVIQSYLPLMIDREFEKHAHLVTLLPTKKGEATVRAVSKPHI